MLTYPERAMMWMQDELVWTPDYIGASENKDYKIGMLDQIDPRQFRVCYAEKEMAVILVSVYLNKYGNIDPRLTTVNTWRKMLENDFKVSWFDDVELHYIEGKERLRLITTSSAAQLFACRIQDGWSLRIDKDFYNIALSCIRPQTLYFMTQLLKR